MLDLAEDFARAPCRPIRFGDVGLDIEERSDGVLVLSARAPLEPYEQNLLRRFWSHGDRRPDKTWIAERDPAGGWRRLSYGQARANISAVAAWLRARGVPAQTGRSWCCPRTRPSTPSGCSAPSPPASRSVRSASTTPCSARTSSSCAAVVDMVRPAVILAEHGSLRPGRRRRGAGRRRGGQRRARGLEGGAVASGDDLRGAGRDRDRGRDRDARSHGRPLPADLGSTGRPKAVVHTQAMMTGNTASGARGHGRRLRLEQDHAGLAAVEPHRGFVAC